MILYELLLPTVKVHTCQCSVSVCLCLFVTRVAFLLDLCTYPPTYQVWINQGDIILIGLRDYQDTKADVILRYNPDEARNLKAYGELPDTGIHLLWVAGVCIRIRAFTVHDCE